MRTEPISALARIVRSKNAGPFTLTLDVLFDSEMDYRRVKESEVITPAVVASRYFVPEEQVRIQHFDTARGIKVSLPRLVPSGDPRDTDVYGAQQHAPLLDLPVPDQTSTASEDDG